MNERAQQRHELNALAGPLSLTPLIGATDSLVRAFGLLMVLWIVGGLHIALMRLMRSLLTPGMRLLASALLAAVLVSCAELILQARALALYQGLGIYLTLIGIHCVLNEQATGTTDRHRHDYPILIVFFSALMLILGLLRELLGNGSLLSHAQWLFGSSAVHWEIDLFGGGLHLALLTPGGFILSGLLLAAKNAWSSRSDSGRSTTRNIDSLAAPKETLHS